MKKIIPGILVAMAVLLACKKENTAVTSDGGNAPNMNSNAFTVLTGTKWKQTHSYEDTGAYAGANLNSWPLSTTRDDISPNDTCELTSKVWWRPDHTWYVIKGQACDASMPDTANNGFWSLSSNDAYYINDSNDSINILELNNNYFKLWFKSVVTNTANVVIKTDYTVWVFEPTN